ncbi:EH signature domain-containing protein [Bradyrhizobium sp. SZCCHNR1070]|uniref:EH signature domain-containing protein n=1 Tax=Bradyrhizobium sp. SZCCHNR1070 TaxID=3057361 RepID=UPI0029162CA5|nr:EH signature domain-containing protein [Bradyrhizobium sp. SZCCHNR1070]
MSGLKASIRTLRTARLVNLAIPPIIRTAREADKIGPAESGSESPMPSKNYNLVAKGILEKVGASGELTRREARDAAWCLWETVPALASNRLAVTSLIKATETSGRRQPFRALASSYMASYAPDQSRIVEISAVLMRLARGMGRPWAPLQSDLNLFHVVEGPQNLARVAVERSISPTEVLSGYGLGAVNAQSGFAKFCIARALEQMRDGKEPRHEVRLQWVRTFALRDVRELLFQEHGPLVANALLLPFGDTTPQEATADKFLAILLRLFGDPRSQPAKWTGMREAAAIVRRWLTKQSLRQFLEVVDRTAVAKMWKHRRAFWSAVYDRGLISDAWVVFSPLGEDEARRTFGKEISFATFNGGSVENGQAVLLLRIGRGVVAEWSHSGKCIIWSDAEARGAPSLHSRTYQPSTLRAPVDAYSDLAGPVFAISHSRPEHYFWQPKVAEKIHQMTGVRISQREYQVK